MFYLLLDVLHFWLKIEETILDEKGNKLIKKTKILVDEKGNAYT